jgi:hypothetical protein
MRLGIDPSTTSAERLAEHCLEAGSSGRSARLTRGPASMAMQPGGLHQLTDVRLRRVVVAGD